MDEKAVESVALAICGDLEIDPEGIDGLEKVPRWKLYRRTAFAAIQAYEAALAAKGMVIVPREPTMPAMEEIFGRGPVDGIPLAEATGDVIFGKPRYQP